MNTTIPNHLEFNDWHSLSEWATEHQHTMPHLFVSQIHKIAQRRFPPEAFTMGQLASKIWLTSVIYDRLGQLDTKDDIAYLGCWIAPLTSFLSTVFHSNRIYGFDSDPDAIAMADDYNSEYVEDDWRFKGVVADVNTIDWNEPEFVVDGELITDFIPDIIVNTSAEHMSDDWFLNAGKDTLVIMQSNNSPNFDGHINCVDSVETLRAQYPMRATIYAGEMVTPAYTRYMQIGFPA